MNDDIMEQAQVFASAWALVGGRFDNGDMMETAESEKAELRRMIERAVEAGASGAAQDAKDEYERGVADSAELVGAEYLRILAQQYPGAADGSMQEAVNGNLRMVAVMLPDLVDNIRALSRAAAIDEAVEAQQRGSGT